MSRYNKFILFKKDKKDEIIFQDENNFKKEKWEIIVYDNKDKDNEIKRKKYFRIKDALNDLKISRTTFYKYNKAGNENFNNIIIKKL